LSIKKVLALLHRLGCSTETITSLALEALEGRRFQADAEQGNSIPIEPSTSKR
jgi:hypothetical protein